MKGIISFIVVAVLLMAGFSYFLNKSVESDNAKRDKKYEECKAQVSDIEWCFKNFRPVLE